MTGESTTSERDVASAVEVRNALASVTQAVTAALSASETLAVIGIRRGGLGLAQHLARALGDRRGEGVQVGSVDIGLYRDDSATSRPQLAIGPSEIPFDVEHVDILMVDDVLHTGRTVRAAINAILDYGRPSRIWLAVLLDRGGRELPIQADFPGLPISVADDERVKVTLEEGLARAWRVKTTSW